MARRAALAVPPAPVIFVDADVFIDWLTRRTLPHPDTGEERWKSAKALFDAILEDRVILASSPLVEAEVACNGDVRQRSKQAKVRLSKLFQAPSTRVTEIDRFLAREAIHLAESFSLRGADATHLASAVRLGCDYLMSHDGKFPYGHTVGGVQVLRPQQVWAPTLLDAAPTG